VKVGVKNIKSLLTATIPKDFHRRLIVQVGKRNEDKRYC
jgi:hypothetical protein